MGAAPQDPNILQLTSMMANFDYVSKNVNDNISERFLEGADVPWASAQFLLVHAFIIIAALSSFYRADFLSVTLAVACAYFQWTNAHHELSYRIVTMMLIFSCIVDVLWLLLFAIPYMAGHSFPDDGVRRLCVVLSLLCLIVKLPAVVVYWRAALNDRKSIG
jgi:hypothetical protein